MEKFKFWVAVNDDGLVNAFWGDKPCYYPSIKQWRNDYGHFPLVYADIAGGLEAIKEIEFELPTKVGKEEAPKGVDAYVAVDRDMSVLLFADKPHFCGSWCSFKGGRFLGYTSSKVYPEESLCKVQLNVPYDIVTV